MNNETVRFFPGKPTPIGEILEEYLKKEGFSEKLKIYRLIEGFGELFPTLIQFCRCEEYKKGILYLSLKDPIFSIEVQKHLYSIIGTYKERGLLIKKVKIRGVYKEKNIGD